MERLPLDATEQIIGAMRTPKGIARGTRLKAASRGLWENLLPTRAHAGEVRTLNKCKSLKIAGKRYMFISADVPGCAEDGVLAALAHSCPDIQRLDITLKPDHGTLSLDEFPNLHIFCVRNYDNVSCIFSASTCKFVHTIILVGCDFTNISPLNCCRGLEELELTDCNNFTDISPMTGLDLVELVIWRCGSFSDLSPLRLFCRLKVLRVVDCNLVSDLSSLSKCHLLTELWLGACKGVKCLKGLENLVHLSDLDASGTDVTNLDPLSNLPELRFLNITQTPVIDLAPLDNLPLTELVILGCGCIADKCAKVIEFREKNWKVRTD
jgi:hypothetical protein